ncbi:MAG: SpoIIE family protein phosphatase [Phycisphaerales bacterium]|nr:SpoIIE family protein phosphatase [Phycisphaerales bacterium]
MNVPDTCVVLLVDDQLIIGEAVRRILAPQEGITFHFCQKGAEALAAAARLKPTVILQDLVMPDADGLDLVRGYRQQEATALTPLIVLSSKEEGTTKAEAFARGANDYIVKLPDPVELVARIRYHSRGYLSLLQRNQAFEDLRASQAALAAELAKAAAYVRSLLPSPIREPVAIDWRFVPSASLGGDCFDYFWIDDDHLALYLLDVCGHGVGPALLGVSASNAVRSSAFSGADLRDPTGVLHHLNAAFPMEKHDNMFFTIWYGVYRRSTRTLSFSGGGHPPPLLVPARLSADGQIAQLLGPGPPIGVDSTETFPTLTAKVTPGSSLLLYSDGVTEVALDSGKLWGIAGLEQFMHSHQEHGPRLLDNLHQRVVSIAGKDVLADDFSTLLATFA